MTYRPELPEPPDRIASLPVDRGYPVPWFVAWVDGEPDFRVVHEKAINDAWQFDLCWLCGKTLGVHRTFVVGPMCAVNRTSAEPPSHADCAEYAVRACPFLARPHMRRREDGLPEGTQEPAGIMLRRNPGVILLWTTKKPGTKFDRNGGMLFDLGPPERVAFYKEGRPATRAEIDESIDSGLPHLAELADAQGPIARKHLDRMVADARELLPA